MTSLTKREKTLLYLLAIFLMAAGLLLWLVVPAGKAYVAQRDGLAALTQQEQLEVAAIAGAGAAQERVNALTDEVKKLGRRYPKAKSSVETDRQFTAMLKSYGLTPEVLTIGGLQQGAPLAAPGEAADGAAAEATLASTEIAISCTGTLKNINRLTAALFADRSLLVTTNSTSVGKDDSLCRLEVTLTQFYAPEAVTEAVAGTADLK
ncbi:MAG: hypothetical protein RR022_07515 [Angelakisella sp.]